MNIVDWEVENYLCTGKAIALAAGGALVLVYNAAASEQRDAREDAVQHPKNNNQRYGDRRNSGQ